MRPPYRWIAVAMIAVGPLLPSCARAPAEEASNDPAQVEPLQGMGVARITLSAEAARRLDVQTAPVREVLGRNGGEARSVIPYAAVLYDPNGEAWAYTSPEPLVFVRAPIRIDHIEGSRAVLSSGPPPGTEVVTVGASELLGTEYQVGEE